MSKKKSNGSSKRDFYSDDMTKAVIGNLFAEYAAEDGKNYFVSDNTRARKGLEEEPEEYDDTPELLEEPELEEEQPEEEVVEYTPRRKRSRVSPEPDEEEEETVKKKGLFSIFGNNDEDEEDEEPDFEMPKKTPREIVEDRAEKAKIPKFMQEYADNGDFDEEEDEDNIIELPIGRVAVVVGAVVIVAIIIILAVSRAGYKNQLAEAQTKIAELEKLTTSSTYESEIAELQAQVNELTAENERLKNSAVTVSGADVEENTNTDGSENTVADTENTNTDAEASNTENTDSDAEINQNSSDEASYTMYTVKAGDYPFSISEEVYGDGSRYKEILELNGITGDDLVAGMEIKIPN